jgi:hypothetical protein
MGVHANPWVSTKSPLPGDFLPDLCGWVMVWTIA